MNNTIAVPDDKVTALQEGLNWAGVAVYVTLREKRHMTTRADVEQALGGLAAIEDFGKANNVRTKIRQIRANVILMALNRLGE